MSERGFSTTIEAELEAGQVSLAFLVELAFVGGTERFWSGYGDLVYDSNTYTGTGELGSIDKVADSLEKSDTGVELVLNYLDDDIRNELIANDSVGEAASIYLAVLADGAVTDAHELYSGFIDQIEILDSGETGEIRVRLASELALLSKPHAMKLTDAHQQYLFAGDLGLEFAARMDEPIVWGRKSTEVRSGSGSSQPAYTPTQQDYFP